MTAPASAPVAATIHVVEGRPTLSARFTAVLILNAAGVNFDDLSPERRSLVTRCVRDLIDAGGL